MKPKPKKKLFAEVPALPDFVKLEEERLKHWYQSGLVKKYLNKNKHSQKKFSFLDGPITANNPMGVHHARGRTYKDLWQRYQTMKGCRQRYQNGFDCQGLWVEVEVERELGFKTKKDIENYGVAKFVNQCKQRVIKYAGVQTEQSKRLGMWMDWDYSYFTMSDKNNYAIWDFLKICHQRNWIYKGHDSVPWCPRCETAISQHEMLSEDYQLVSHQAIYFTLPLLNRKNEYLLVWTTTPWTLPANIAVAVDKKLDYSLVQYQRRRYWLAKEAIATIFKEKPEIIRTVKGKDLLNLKYRTAFDHLPAVAETAKKHPEAFHLVIPTDPLILPISMTEGTGLVHTAVSAGSEDYQLGQKLKLPLIPVIGDNAEYLGGLGFLSGKNAKKHPELILDYLVKEDKKADQHWVFKIHPFKHRYPVCWRCKTELVWKVTDEWYISMDWPDPTDPKKRTLRQQLIEITKQIAWIPDFGLERELDWLRNMHDWLISKKNRFWGLALPIYECPHCHSFEVIGSKKELQQRAVQGWQRFSDHSPHKPWIDYVKIRCSKCDAVIKRIEPVGSPWLDAGIVSISTLPKAWFPAEFITECFPGQFKNWFYSLLVMATVLKKNRPFKTVLGFEAVVGADGRPMHKSLGNAIEFNQGAKKIGVDVMRWMFCTSPPTAVLAFGYDLADAIRRQFILILWNSYRFFVTQAQADRWSPPSIKLATSTKLSLLDRWILSRLQQTTKTVTESLDHYLCTPAAEALASLVKDFSGWYIRRSRDRVGPTATNQTDKNQAYQTMYQVLVSLSQLLAPFIPYLSDYLYTQLTDQDSAHLSDWPKPNPRLIRPTLEKKMAQARLLVEKIHSQRKAVHLPVRQPLAKATVKGKTFAQSVLLQLVLEETNLRKLEFTNRPGDYSVKLDTRLTPDLKQAGQARQIIRQVQAARKQAGCRPDQLIDLQLPAWPKKYTKYIKQKTLARTLVKADKFKLK